jgi:hypothetical protein
MIAAFRYMAMCACDQQHTRTLQHYARLSCIDVYRHLSVYSGSMH